MAASFAVATIFTAKDRITKAFNRMGKGADDFGNRADKALKKASKSAKKLDVSFKSITKGILAASGIQLGLSSINNLRMEIIETGKKADALGVVFRTVFGKGAANEMQFVRTEAERLGLQFDAVAKEYTKVAAATKGTTLEGKATRELFIAMSEASTALQLSADDTGGALRALTQIISKGKVQAEELRGQLGERLPGAFEKAARAMGVTQIQLNDMMKDGDVLANDFIPKFTKVLKQDFSKSAMDAAGSFQAMENRFKTAMFDFRASFGKILLPIMTKFFQVATKITKPIADFIEANSKLINQNIDEIFKSAAESFKLFVDEGSKAGVFESIGMMISQGLVPAIKSLFKTLDTITKTLGETGTLKDLAKSFISIGKAINTMAKAVAYLNLVLKPTIDALGYLRDLNDKLNKGVVGRLLNQTTNPMSNLTGNTIGALVGGAIGGPGRTEAEKRTDELMKKHSESLWSGKAPNKEVAEARARAFQVNVGGKFTFENAPKGMNFVQTRDYQMQTSGLGAQ